MSRVQPENGSDGSEVDSLDDESLGLSESSESTQEEEDPNAPHPSDSSDGVDDLNPTGDPAEDLIRARRKTRRAQRQERHAIQAALKARPAAEPPEEEPPNPHKPYYTLRRFFGCCLSDMDIVDMGLSESPVGRRVRVRGTDQPNVDEIAIPVMDGDIDATKHACTRDLVDPEKVNTHDRRGHTPLALSLMEQRHDLFDTLIGWLWGDIYSAMCEHGSPGTLRRYTPHER